MPTVRRGKSKHPKKPRRARGTGSIFPDRRRGGYRAKVPIGKYPDGRTRYTEVSGKTQAETVAKMRDAEPPDPNTVTVAGWAKRWIAGLTNRSSTCALYAHSINTHVVPLLGHVRLSALTVSQVKAAAATLCKKPYELAPQTVNLTLDRAGTMFAAAITDNLATRNPFALCPRLEYTRKPIDPFTPAELKQIVAAHALLSSAPLFAFLAATGARLGEAGALDITDYDPATGAVRITKTWCPQHGTRPPKSRHSTRTLVVPEPARPALSAAIRGRTAGALFATRSGTRFDPPTLRSRFATFLKRLGIRPRTPHATRHGVATALVSAGVPIADVAKWLGDSVATVVKTYLHAAGHDVPKTLSEMLA